MPPSYTDPARERRTRVSGPGKGKKGFYVELPEDLAAAFRQFARGRGETLGEATAQAMRRHMAHPPPPAVDPPLPPLPTEESPKKKGKG